MRIFVLLSIFILGGFVTPSHAAEKTAVFAGGCFWCLEADFDKHDGVKATISGFAGGNIKNPSYTQVVQGNTGHIEVVEVQYDPEIVSYEHLLEVFWASIDPLDGKGQFCDRGHSYKPAIFYNDEDEKILAEQSQKAADELLGKDSAVELIALDAFYPAEEYHQDYYLKNPKRYAYYRWSCGRNAKVKKVWGKHAGKSIQLF